jgi:hypothetical protein
MSNFPPFRIASAPFPEELPVRVDRRAGAALVTHYFFPVADRSLERWPLIWIAVKPDSISANRSISMISLRPPGLLQVSRRPDAHPPASGRSHANPPKGA